MDALEELSQNYHGSSQGSGNFNRQNIPSMTRFDNNEGADVLRMYPGEGNRGFGSASPPAARGYGDNYSQEDDPHFGIDRHKDNFQRATNLIDNYVPQRNPRGRMADDTASFDKYSGGGNYNNEPYEDILDSIKGDAYDRAEETGRFRGPSVMDQNYPNRNQEYSERRGGPISVEAQSIPDFERSQVSSRDEDLRSMQPQGFKFTGQSWNKQGNSNNRVASSGTGGRRKSIYRNDNSASGIDVIDSSASRRMRTTDSRNVRKTKDDVPIFLAKKPGQIEGSKPPLHKNASMLDDDKLSQVRERDGTRSGRFRESDASDITSRRRAGQDNSFKMDQSGVPALDSSASRRARRQIQPKDTSSRHKDPEFRRGVSSHVFNA